MSLRKFILFSTVVSVFTEALSFNYRIDIKIFYFVVLMNLFLISFIDRLRLNLYWFSAILYLFATGILSIATRTNSWKTFLAQFIGITTISFYYYNFFRVQKKDVVFIFDIFATISYWVSAIGLCIFVYHLVIEQTFQPVKSIMLEPQHFVMVVLPAVYYYAESWRSFGSNKYRTLTIFTAIILAGSAMGYLGLMFLILLMRPKRRSLGVVVATSILVILSFSLAYTLSRGFQTRLNDTARAVQIGDLSGSNLSTFALLSNAYVALESAKLNPVLGSGLGSHELSHAKFVDEITGVTDFDDFIELNAKDANSLFLRILSDLGGLGLILAFYFVYKFRISGAESAAQISNAVLIYFFLKLFREGHYFSPEMYFFVFAYVFNYLQFKDVNRSLSAHV